MWVFYLISLPLTVAMVIFTLRYFAGPEVRRYVLLIVGYAWFCSLSIIILVPADIWTPKMRNHFAVSVHPTITALKLSGAEQLERPRQNGTNELMRVWPEIMMDMGRVSPP